MANNEKFERAVESGADYGAFVTVAMIEAGMPAASAVRLGALAGSFVVLVGDKIDEMSPDEFLAEFWSWVRK